MLPRWLMVYKLKGPSSDVLLTFDDGPDPAITPLVLDILKAKQKKAIFFVVGEKAEEYPEIVKRMDIEGHVVGNHTYSHPHNRKISMLDYRADIAKAQVTLKTILGYRPNVFRPPCGEFNLKTVLSAKSLGLEIMLMSNGGGEWNENANAPPETIEHQILHKIEKEQIIVMHDNNKKIPMMLTSLIEKIEALGLKVANPIKTNSV
jgi:peptidoglycan/xylan/chitin deacetylase (PgdA/CDA1 family)